MKNTVLRVTEKTYTTDAVIAGEPVRFITRWRQVKGQRPFYHTFADKEYGVVSVLLSKKAREFNKQIVDAMPSVEEKVRKYVEVMK